MALQITPIALAIAMLSLPHWAVAQTQENKDKTPPAETTLPTVQVSATLERAGDLPAAYAGGQVARGARLGLLGNQDVMDVPFNITSYTAQLIEDQGAQTVADVLNNDPSVRFTTSGSHAYENFRLRGFDVHSSDLAINGLYGLAPLGHASLEFAERVEVFKGPSAMFAGMAPSGGIGGTINLVPKRAGDTPLTRVSVGYQTENQLSTSIDAGRRFGSAKEFGVRVNGAYSDGEAALKGQDKTHRFFSTALDYRGTALTASLDVYDGKDKFSGGSAAMFGFASPNLPAAPDGSINMLSSAAGELASRAIIARAEYAVNSQFSLFASAGARTHDYSGWVNGTHVHNIQSNGSAQVRGVAQRGYDDSQTAEAGARLYVAAAGVNHDLVLQATRLELESGSLSNVTGMVATNIYQPVVPPLPAMPALYVPKGSSATLSSLALVDNIALMQDRLRLTVGVRQQQVQQRSYNSAGAQTANYDEAALTPAMGVVFKPWGEGLALYASYVQGLSQGASVKLANGYVSDQTFKPYKTDQRELGVKWNAGRYSHTADYFEIAKPELITTGTAPKLVASDSGESKVSGVEWNTFGQILPTLTLLGGVSYTKSELTKSAGGINQGNELFGVPRWQANLGTEWDTPLAGVHLNARVIATSKQYLNNANTYQIPGWGQLDVGGRYETRLAQHRAVLRLSINNLLDRAYYSGSFAEPRATLALGRTVQTSLSVDF